MILKLRSSRNKSGIQRESFNFVCWRNRIAEVPPRTPVEWARWIGTLQNVNAEEMSLILIRHKHADLMSTKNNIFEA